jgi:hypothetical protein
MAGADQVFGELGHPVEIVGGLVEVGFAGLFPRAAQPFHRIDDGVDVFLLFLLRVGVVEAQVAAAAVLGGEAEVEQDGLGVAEVQVTVRLGREAGADLAGSSGAAAWSAAVPGRPAQRRWACLPAARSASTMFLMKLAAGAGCWRAGSGCSRVKPL